MEPTEEQVEKFDNVLSIFKWAGIRGDVADEATPLGALCEALEVDGNEHFGPLAILTKEEWAQICQEIKIKGEPPKPMAMCKYIAAGIAIRIAGETQPRSSVQKKTAASPIPAKDLVVAAGLGFKARTLATLGEACAKLQLYAPKPGDQQNRGQEEKRE